MLNAAPTCRLAWVACVLAFMAVAPAAFAQPVVTARPLVACPVQQKAVNSDAKPDPGLLSRLIQCLWEKPAAQGMDGDQTIDVLSLNLGSSRKARVTDFGARDNNATIYPALVRYRWTTYYRSRTVTRDNNEAVFNCYVDSFGLWQCGLAERRVDAPAVDSPPLTR